MSSQVAYTGSFNGTIWTSTDTDINIVATIITNQITSVVFIDSVTLFSGGTYNSSKKYNDIVVVLDNTSAPGRIVTVRDTSGKLGNPTNDELHYNRVIVITNPINEVIYLDSVIKYYYMSQPYSYITVTCRDPKTWALQNTFAFEAGTVVPTVLGMTSRYLYTSSLYTEVLSTGLMNVSSFAINSLQIANMITTSSLTANYNVTIPTGNLYSFSSFISALTVSSVAGDGSALFNLPAYSSLSIFSTVEGIRKEINLSNTTQAGDSGLLRIDNFFNILKFTTQYMSSFIFGTSTANVSTLLANVGNVSSLNVSTGNISTLLASSTFTNYLSNSGLTVLNSNLTMTGTGFLSNAGAFSNIGFTVLANTLNVGQATTLSNILNVGQATTLSNTLNVNNVATFASNVTITNTGSYLSNAGTFSNTGLTVLANTLNVGQATTLNDTLNVNLATTLSNTLNVNNIATFASNISLTTAGSYLSNEGSFSNKGITVLANTLNVGQATTLSNILNVAQTTTLSNTLRVRLGTTLSNTLDVTNVATFASNVLLTATGSYLSNTGNLVMPTSGNFFSNAGTFSNTDRVVFLSNVLLSNTGSYLSNNGNLVMPTSGNFFSNAGTFSNTGRVVFLSNLSLTTPNSFLSNAGNMFTSSLGLNCNAPSFTLDVNGIANLSTLTGVRIQPSLVNKFIVVGIAGNSIIVSSSDGLTWPTPAPELPTIGSSGLTAGHGIAWNGKLWVAVGTGTIVTANTKSIAYSADGVNWTLVATNPFTTSGYGVAWNGSLWIAVGAGTNAVATSSDGITWAPTATIGTSGLTIGRGIAWNGKLWVAVGTGNSKSIAYSADGVGWTLAGTNPFTTSGYGVAWNGKLWVAVGTGGNSLATSVDGATWTPVTNALTTGQGVAWNGRVWVVVGTGTSQSIIYSFDGLFWQTAISNPFTTGYSVAWNGNVFVAVGDGANAISKSTDGITWSGPAPPNFLGFGTTSDSGSLTQGRGVAFSYNPTPAYSQQMLDILPQNIPTFFRSTNQIFLTSTSMLLNDTLSIDRTTASIGINAVSTSYNLDVWGSTRVLGNTVLSNLTVSGVFSNTGGGITTIGRINLTNLSNTGWLYNEGAFSNIGNVTIGPSATFTTGTGTVTIGGITNHNGATNFSNPVTVGATNTLTVGAGLTTLGGSLTMTSVTAGISNAGFLSNTGNFSNAGTTNLLGPTNFSNTVTVGSSCNFNVGTGLTTLGGSLTMTSGTAGISNAGFLSNTGNFSNAGTANLVGPTNFSNTVTIGSSCNFNVGTGTVTFGNGIFNNSGVTNLSNNVRIVTGTFSVGSNVVAASFAGNLTVTGTITGNISGQAGTVASVTGASGNIAGQAGTVATIAGVSGNIPGTALNASNVVTGGTINTGTIGCTTLTASVDVVVSSDRRLKINISTIENSLSTVNGMRGVFYTLLSDPTFRKVGVIAQEMEQALPEVVSTDKTEEKIKGVAYGNINAVLIEAVKELTKRMERVERALNLRPTDI